MTAHNHDTAMAEILAAMDAPPPSVEAFTGMIYGPSGAGKTVLAATLGNVLNKPGQITLIVDTSRGFVSLNNHPKLSGTFKVVPYKDMASLETLAIMLERKHSAMANVGTVVFDEISKMVRVDTDSIAAANNQDTPEWPDYNKSLNRLRHVVYRLLKRPDLNIIELAHERDKKNKAGAIVMTHADFIPSVVKELKEDIHVVARLTAAAVTRPGQAPKYERQVQTMPTAMIDAKSRMPALPVVVSPDVFVQHVIDWLASGGQLGEEQPMQEGADLADLEGVPLDVSGETILDDSPAWSN